MMKLPTWIELSAIIIITIGLSACEIIPPVLSLVNTGLLYQLKNQDKIEVTTISKECYLFRFQCLTEETKDSINPQDWDIIAYNNRVIVENCPNIDKPNCKDVIAARSKH